MAVLTNLAKVDNAIRLYKDAQSMYFALGNYKTPWPGGNPLDPSPSQTSLSELVGLKKVTTVSLAVETSASTGANIVTYKGTYYELIGLADAYTRGATFVYIASTILNADFEEPIFRSVALTANPTFKAGVTGDAVSAEFVTSQGRLQAIDNVVEIDRTGLDITEYVIVQA